MKVESSEGVIHTLLSGERRESSRSRVISVLCEPYGPLLSFRFNSLSLHLSVASVCVCFLHDVLSPLFIVKSEAGLPLFAPLTFFLLSMVDLILSLRISADPSDVGKDLLQSL